VLLAEPPSTNFDVHFKLGSIPVRVHPLFWLISLVFGAMAVRGAGVNIFVGMALWTAAVFVSILVHELGHALTAKAHGWPPKIVLHAMGGLAIYTPTRRTRRAALLIDFMGPGAGFIMGAVILAAVVLTGHSVDMLGLHVGSGPDFRLGGGRLELFITFMLYVNIFWGLLNLMPVQPLDGGHIAKTILEKYRPRDAWSLSLKLGIATAGVLAAVALITMGDYWLAFMFGWLGYNNWQMLSSLR
jgi:Zn-dependent protease